MAPMPCSVVHDTGLNSNISDTAYLFICGKIDFVVYIGYEKGVLVYYGRYQPVIRLVVNEISNVLFQRMGIGDNCLKIRLESL